MITHHGNEFHFKRRRMNHTIWNISRINIWCICNANKCFVVLVKWKLSGDRLERDQLDKDQHGQSILQLIDLVDKKLLIIVWSLPSLRSPKHHGERARSYTSCKEWKCCSHREDSRQQGEKVWNSKVRYVNHAGNTSVSLVFAMTLFVFLQFHQPDYQP